MTAVEGWFSDKHVRGAEIKISESLSPAALDLVSQNISINRSCTVRFKDEEVRHSPYQGEQRITTGVHVITTGVKISNQREV